MTSDAEIECVKRAFASALDAGRRHPASVLRWRIRLDHHGHPVCLAAVDHGYECGRILEDR